MKKIKQELKNDLIMLLISVAFMAVMVWGVASTYPV